MNDQDLILHAPHNKEEDGELIPDFTGPPRIYKPDIAPVPGEKRTEADYLVVAKKYKKRSEKHKRQMEKTRLERLKGDPVRERIEHMNKMLTPSERDMLFIIRIYQWEERYSPTGWELGLITGTSSQWCRRVISRLVDKGVLEMSPHLEGRDYMKRVLMPRGSWWPWHDYTQFPPCIFWDKNEDRYGEIAKKAHEMGLE